MVEPIISLSLLSSSPTKNSPVVMTTCRFRFFWALEVALPQRGIYEFRFTLESGPQHSIPRVRTMGKPTCLAAFTPFAPHLPLNLDFFLPAAYLDPWDSGTKGSCVLLWTPGFRKEMDNWSASTGR